MAQQRLPPGFRFHPTDEELVACYLKNKINGRPIEMNPIAAVDLYKVEPWDLPAMSRLQSSDQEWYFYSARDRKYPNGSRTNRATEIGYWKSTGKDRIVKCPRSTGMKKTLVYYRGRAPRGERTDWVMHEYRMEDKVYENLTGRQEPYVLVRMFKKSGAGPKNGEQYGAPFIEEAYSPAIEIEDEVVPLEPEQPEAEAEAEVKVEPVPEMGVAGAGNVASPDSFIEEFLAVESGHGHVDDWADCPEELEDLRPGDDLQEILDTIEWQSPQEDSWKEAVIDNDLMFDEEFFNGDGLDGLGTSEGLDVDGNGDYSLYFDIGMPSGGSVSTDDYLEINDLISDLEGFDPRGSEIQLRPPRNNAMAMQFDSQGDSARRMLLMRPQASISHATMPAVNHQSRILHTSVSSRDLSQFADLASDLDLPVSSGGWSYDTEPQDVGREGEGEGFYLQRPLGEWSNGTGSLDMGREGVHVSDSDFLSNYEGMLPSSSSEDPQRAVVESQGGSLQPELNFSSGSSDFSSGFSWPDFDPPAPSQVADKPSEKGKSLGINKLMPILQASAAELPSFSSTYVTASDTQLTALTITCSCTENGAKTVQAALMNYTGGKLHQEVMSGTWKPCTEDCKQDSCVQCRSRRQPQRKVAKGSMSGFVFVFLLGVVSALIWYFLLRSSWQIAKTIFKVIL